jgi:hypothetical protein
MAYFVPETDAEASFGFCKDYVLAYLLWVWGEGCWLMPDGEDCPVVGVFEVCGIIVVGLVV